ncbi:MAG: ATP-binding protein [Acidobacteriota bacterium]
MATRFRDRSLKSRLIVTIGLLVTAVTLSLLSGFYLSFRQLRDQAVPDQRLILSLQSLGYDYLSEVREYALSAEAETLEELHEAGDEMLELLQEYGGGNPEDPDREAVVEALRQGISELIASGSRVVAVEDLERSARREIERAERSLVTGSSLDRNAALGFEYLSLVRLHLLDPSAADDVARLEEAIVSLGSEPILERALAAGRQALSLQEELGGVLEDLEDREQRLRTELDIATQLAERDLVEATNRMVLRVAVVGGLGLLLAVLVATWLAGWIARPIEQLRDAARRLAAGELEARAPVESSDELGQLCVSFNQLAAEIERLVTELRESVTELRRSQAQLIQSGKMIAVGELSAGVAHELNNPLSVVLTYSVLMQEDHDQLSEVERRLLETFPERLELVRTAAQRCKTIVDGLLQFSRQDDAELGAVDLREVLVRTFDLIGSQLRRGQVRWSLDLEPGLPPACANANQLQQIFTNLALNAMQAMPSGGELEVVGRTGAEDAERCEIRFRDSGSGISPDHLERIFEPFFTTKARGEGTGLGLSIALGIIQRHGGEITVDSTPGEGTTFLIRLPRFAQRGAS